MKPILRSSFPSVAGVTLAVAAVALGGFLVGSWRRSEDADWCRKAMPTAVLIPGTTESAPGSTLKRQRSACAAIRRTQRGRFGAVWRTGGQAMAACGVEWGRFQQLSLADPVNAAAAVLERYGIHDPLDPSRLSDQRRFIQACLAAGAHRPG